MNIPRQPPMPTLRVGIDLCWAGEVAEAIERFGDDYLGRIYTGGELASCRSGEGDLAERLAARFAAKEAAFKVLHVAEGHVDWRNIEVERHDSGWCAIRLHGELAEVAAEAGITTLELSLSHDHGLAAAVVVALLEPQDAPADLVDLRDVNSAQRTTGGALR